MNNDSDQPTGSRRQRSRRTIAQRSLAGLSIAGMTVTVALTSAAGSAPAAAGSSSRLRGVTTLTETTSSAAGTMATKIRYQRAKGNRIKLLSVTYSGESKVKVRKPELALVFQVRREPVVVLYARLRPGELHHFSGSLPAREISATRRRGGLIGGETLLVSLLGPPPDHSYARHTPRLVMQVGLVLTPGSGY